MKYCSAFCENISFKKKKGGLMVQGDAAIEMKRQNKALEKMLSPEEKALVKQEKEVGLDKIEYEQFVFMIKRYCYSGSPFQDKMLETVAPELNIDYSTVKEEDENRKKPLYVTLKNPFLFHKGNFDIPKLISMGFLLCFHFNHQTRLDEFWQLVNPEIEEEASLEDIVTILKNFIYVAVIIPYQIEEAREENKDENLLQYLRSLLDPNSHQSKDEEKKSSSKKIELGMIFEEMADSLVARLLNVQNVQEVLDQGCINFQDLVELVNVPSCMTTYGIRMKLLKTKDVVVQSAVSEQNMNE